ncbi:GNAT family N-acetyltransferase [Kineosporia sp. J2-2]|uniref:GNAT family N-acetyltransferase n=1 Tax=Kineosporia corallincola TaxID=2835133 RepID=A0ABS5TDQ1_9ACTN|nr:GNAT family N-acetyltransferase [Kineosporia corallincola]MBT0768326.1 GNAT family N-acetyltransferase [Kineosporia corallincola]
MTDGRDRPVTLRGVGDENWRDIADVVPRDDQRDWVATSAARYLLLSLREGVWTSLGVYAGDQVVGHIMWAYDEDDDRNWIGGMLVDEQEQGTGVGRAALLTLIGYLRELPEPHDIRLSVHDDNTAARKLYASAGFVELDRDEDGDWTAELVLSPPEGGPHED